MRGLIGALLSVYALTGCGGTGTDVDAELRADTPAEVEQQSIRCIVDPHTGEELCPVGMSCINEYCEPNLAPGGGEAEDSSVSASALPSCHAIDGLRCPGPLTQPLRCTDAGGSGDHWCYCEGVIQTAWDCPPYL